MKSGNDKWSKLDNEARPVLKDILNRWERLIHRENVREQQVHCFLQTHAHLFFRKTYDFCTVISKLRFGADFVSDFVSVHDHRSNGVHYHLIELERPDVPPFTKEGIASSKLSRAIQQLLSWKTWLNEHPAEAGKLFPSASRLFGGRTSFSYEIIIGTRANSAAWLERRNVLADSLTIEIRSFDSLSDEIKTPRSFDDYAGYGDEERNRSLDERNKLVCPFLKALSDTQWREIIGIKGRRYPDHVTDQFADDLIRLRQASRYLGRFRNFKK